MFELEKVHFKNHIATLVLNDEQTEIQVIDYREPGTGICAMRFILDGYFIHISGDLGTAIYETTWINNILEHNYQGLSLDYFSEKLSTSKREKYKLNKEKAKKDIKEFYQHILENKFSDEQLSILFDFKKQTYQIEDELESIDMEQDTYNTPNEMLENEDVQNIIDLLEILDETNGNESFTTEVCNSLILEKDTHDLWESVSYFGRELSDAMRLYLYAIKDIAKQLQSNVSDSIEEA